MIIKLYEKYVEFLDSSIKKLYSEICAISSTIKSKLPKPKPKPPKTPKFVQNKYEQRPVNPTSGPINPQYYKTKVIKESPKKNVDYLEEIQRELKLFDRCYDNSSQALTGTFMNNQQTIISGTAYNWDKIIQSKTKNVTRRATRIIDELSYFEGEDKPKPLKTRKPKFPDGRSITA